MRGGRWVVVSPFGVFGGRNRGYGPGWGQGYDPRYDRGYGGYGGRGGYGRRGSGGGCLRDLLLLEGGCCLAEALGGSCLLHTGWLLPALAHALTTPSTGRGGHVTSVGSRSQRVLLAMIGSYQRNVSAHRARPVCRFTPSCSAYAAEAVSRHGAVTGTRRALGRLLRCRPGARGGLDPVA